MLELQSFIFEQEPSRRALLDYRPLSTARYRLCVYRNHSFELIEHTIPAYLDYAGLTVEFHYSDYDDSLSFLNLSDEDDALLLWLDLSRYHTADLQAFLEDRLAWLESHYPKPVLFVPFGGSVGRIPAGITVFSLEEIASQLGPYYLDLRLEAFSGTKLSARACISISRELGLRYLPALLRPALKAVILDLDNTLYQGVLGEDGVEGVILTDGHRYLQEHLKALGREGFFLCAATKNDERDVVRLFQTRTDFPLSWPDFTKVYANWGTKSDSVAELASYLNISVDSMVLIDDNPGELAAMTAAFPSIHLIRAYEDAHLTLRVVRSYPGLLKLHSSREDSLRKTDVKANEARQRLKSELTPQDYIKTLGMKLTFTYDDPSQAPRIAELANKTNQFIFRYRRYSLAEVERLMAAPDYCIVTLTLSDKLSDSGIIGVCVGRDAGAFIALEECFISCRALGRGIDDILVLGAVSGLTEFFKKDMVRVDFVEGERNEPAKRFALEKLSPYLGQPAPFHYEIPPGLVTVETRHKKEP